MYRGDKVEVSREVEALGDHGSANDPEDRLPPVTSGSYYPTVFKLKVRRRTRHAAEHRLTEQQVAGVDDARCHDVLLAQDASCPLLDDVEAIEVTEHGARLKVRRGADVRSVLQHIRCHMAYRDTPGATRPHLCPLYLPAVNADLGREGGAIELTVPDEGLEALRKRLELHFGDLQRASEQPEAPATPSE